MENITIEDIEFLKNLAKKIKTQDNRCTAKPILFHIAEPHNRADINIDYADVNHYEVSFQDGEYETFSHCDKDLDDIKEELIEIIDDISSPIDCYGCFIHLSKDIEYDEESDDAEEILEKQKIEITKFINEAEDWDTIKSMIDDDLDHVIDYVLLPIVQEVRYHNTFLTEEAAKAHLESNHYHYNKDGKPYTYVTHAWRNPELERLLKIVEKFDE